MDFCRNIHRGRVSDPNEARHVAPCAAVVKALIDIGGLAFGLCISWLALGLLEKLV